jgi:hypothetical protein
MSKKTDYENLPESLRARFDREEWEGKSIGAKQLHLRGARQAAKEDMYGELAERRAIEHMREHGEMPPRGLAPR